MNCMNRFGWLLTGMLGFGLAGCHLFPHLGGTEADKAQKDPLPIVGVPSKHFKRVSQFCFYSDFELRKDHPFFKEISNHREHVYRELRLPPSNTDVFVYVFENKETYDQFLQRQHPQLPERRAFFVAQAMRRGKTDDL